MVQAAADQPLEMNLPDGVSVTLEPSSVAQWQPAGKLPSEINKWTRGYHLVLEEGELEVRMPPAPKGAHAFLVSCRAGTLTDWRGQLHVKVHEDSAAAAIYEGALVVGSNGQGFPVYDGAGIVLRRGVNPDKTRGIPAAPQWAVTSSGFLMQATDGRGPIDLAWGAVERAASYRVEVATDAAMVRVVDRTAIPDTHYSTTLETTPGRYWAHARAVSPEGIVGPWSPTRAINVLRYSLPDGAFVARDGAIVLPERSGISFPDSDGLEVAFENVASAANLPPPVARDSGHPPSHATPPLYWSPLGGSIRVSDQAPLRIVHLRDPSSGAQTRLVLARRQLRAIVDLSPPNAVWPSNPIDARIHVEDPSGRVDVAHEPVVVEATLGLSPLGVNWQHDGSSWNGRIAPRFIGAPAVVRVVVKDGHGAEIGRGFMELEPIASNR
jgi:hypothetical protein